MAIINTVLGPIRFLKLGPFKHGRDSVNFDAICQEQIQLTGLSDYGDLSFISSYKNIASTPYYKQIVFSHFGFLNAVKEVGVFLKRRLMLTQYFKSAPEVLSVKIEQPVFVFGIGRSGTTFVHRLLSLDPRSRGPMIWEIVSPVPEVPKDASSAEFKADRAKRAAVIKHHLDQKIALGMRTLEQFHEIGYDLEEECLFGMNDEVPIGVHYVMSNTMDKDEYNRVVPSKDILRAYQSWKRQLQLLTFQMKDEDASHPRRWVLKCPLHINYIKELATVFPYAKLVWAHRHPFTTISSACSLLRAFHEMYFERECLDPIDLGRRSLKYVFDVFSQAPVEIAKAKLQCADVVFENLTRDPIGTVKSIYRQFDWEFTKEYEQILKNYLAEDEKKRKVQFEKASKNKFQVHSPEYFGLSKKEIDERFADYMRNYSIPEEKKSK